MNMITYKACKNKIERQIYDTKEEMQVMLDVFWVGGRISQEQYEELTELLATKEVA